jgi:glycosyltransferase involved in cell wall biosynthesis
MLFGALAGAREVLIIDTQGNVQRSSRAKLLFGAPSKLSSEAVATTRTLRQAKRELDALEREVQQRSLVPASRIMQRTVASSNQIRILYLRSTPGPGTQAGGAASHIKGVVEGLVELGADIHVISNDRIAGFNETKAPLTVIEPQAFGATRAISDIHNNQLFTSAAVPLIQQDDPDLIYQRYARFSWAGVVAALRTNRPLFLEYNGSEVWVGRHWDRVGRLDLLERYEDLNLNAAARIFVVSEVERRNLEKAGVEPRRIIVNPNGADTEMFRPDIGGQQERRELGIELEEVVVGFVGTFGPWHGVLVLAEAIRSISAKLAIRFVLVGSGNLQYEMEELLQRECESRRVVFAGSVNHERVPVLLDACDILVSPHVPLAEGNEFFGSPTKLFEYMAMGKAIVASRLGQISEVIDHEKTGLLVEPGNVDELATAILRLAESPALRQQLGEKARQKARESYTWKHNAQRVLDAYHSWVNDQSRK